MLIEIKGSSEQRLDRIANITKADSLTKVVARALKLYDYVVTEALKGNNVVQGLEVK